MNHIRKQARRFLIVLACALFLGVCASATSAKMLNGYYEADNGGAYFIRQIGDSVYWFGEDPNGAWANVLMGTISGNKITARFWDVPKGRTQGMGEMVLQIQNDDSLIKLSSSTPFGTKSWKKMVGHMEMVNGVGVLKGVPPQMRSRPQGYSGGEQNLTGAWQGDDAAFYYVRETPTDIVWVAENNQWGGPGGNIRPSFTHVFFGKHVKGDPSISGHWIDIPKGEAAGSGTLTVTIKSPQDMETLAKTGSFAASTIWRSLPNSLRGYADLHTHPMVNLGFGGKWIHGGVDVGSLLPADADCNHNVRAKSIGQALGSDNPTHGVWVPIDNPCGDALRAAFIKVFQAEKNAVLTNQYSVGYPTFKDYPKWNDISHQKMWVDWIRRSYDSGQRVMVALATHNATLAAAASGPGDGPTDDATSADLQIKEMKALVARHSDFMEVAFSPADLRRIVTANKMAVVIGIEIDNIGNFNKLMLNPVPTPLITNEIKRLHDEGVRYIFPVHVLDNTFGHTAVYEDLFNYSNKREEGHFWDLQCADPKEGIDYQFSPLLPDAVPSAAKDMLGALATMVKVSLDLKAPKSPGCVDPKSQKIFGHKNKFGLNPEGRFAIKEMMKLGMLVDVDHMSEKGVYETLDEAEKIPGGYPLVSGHTNIRPYQGNENSRTSDQLGRIGKLGGMFGLGSDDVSANFWAARYVIADDWIRGDKSKGPILSEGRVAFGTDLNGLVKGPPPRPGASIYRGGFSPSTTGDKTWDYRKDGVAHYGMLADFREDIRTVPVYGERVYSSMLKNAEMFAEMWEKAVKNSANVPR